MCLVLTFGSWVIVSDITHPHAYMHLATTFFLYHIIWTQNRYVEELFEQ